MPIIKLFHRSDHIINEPEYSLGKSHNDYGQGFYCTENIEMAKEWACKDNKDGFVNEYNFNTDDLKVLNLLDGKYSILNWIAILLKNRIFTLQDEISIDARDYIISNFSIDISDYDVVIGYRADDSYFSYAQSFISNTLPLRSLEQALKLGALGSQIALVSKKAFNQIEFVRIYPVNKELYFPKFYSRDSNARETYHKKIRGSRSYRNDIFVMDILREGIKNDDPRIQRIILK